MNAPPTRDRGAARAALRQAIRQHPDFGAKAGIGSREVGNLSMKELYALAYRLGLDPRAITAGARDGVATPATTPDPDFASDGDGDGEVDAPTDGADAMADAVENEVRAIRDHITQNGFGALDDKLRELVSEARKPPVIMQVPAGIAGAAPVIMAKPTGKSVTWRDAFKVRNRTLGARTCQVWDGAHPDTPRVDPLYVWPEDQTLIALTQIARGKNVYAFGPAGTGKTQWCEQLAAQLGRPFALISCDAATDGPTLVGMTVPKGDSVGWQDGQLTRAIQIPGCVICIDEVSLARAGALAVMHNVLANRVLWIAETGRRVPVAPGVIFIACDNTAGMGGGSRRGYTDTNRLNAAFLDRFGARPRFTWLPADKEARVIVDRTSCPLPLAELLVQAATLTRAAADSEQITSGLGLRRLMAWAELLTDGIDAASAFEATIINAAPEQDHETLRQQCALACDAQTIANALSPAATGGTTNVDPTQSNPTAQGRRAAADFTLTN